MQENIQAYMANNQMYQQANIIQFRLDTSEILQNIQRFLSGEIFVPVPQNDGTTKFEKQQVGEPLCNRRGSQQIINYLSGIINPAVVQGNYDLFQYENHVNRIHLSITRQLIINYQDWDMKYQDLELINDVIMNIIETFLSRLIDNKERESYMATMKSNETNRVETGNKLFGLFGG